VEDAGEAVSAQPARRRCPTAGPRAEFGDRVESRAPRSGAGLSTIRAESTRSMPVAGVGGGDELGGGRGRQQRRAHRRVAVGDRANSNPRRLAGRSGRSWAGWTSTPAPTPQAAAARCARARRPARPSAHRQHGGHEQRYPGPAAATDRVIEQYRFDHDTRGDQQSRPHRQLRRQRYHPTIPSAAISLQPRRQDATQQSHQQRRSECGGPGLPLRRLNQQPQHHPRHRGDQHGYRSPHHTRRRHHVRTTGPMGQAAQPLSGWGFR
jgi:hypothetical protein